MHRNRLGRHAHSLFYLVLVSSALVYTLGGPVWHPSEVRVGRSHTAAIIDELSATIPNQSFRQEATARLARIGFAVDYYSPSQVTVEFLRTLPSLGYGIVLLRAHSTGWDGDTIAILTSEQYSSDRHSIEQVTGQVVRARLGVVNQDFFAITPNFVREAMQGVFPGSIIVMMGCTGLISSEMAQAFVAKGAEVYVSWDEVVYASRTDMATLALLQNLASGKPIDVAVAAATDNIPPDLTYNSQLGYYPLDHGAMLLTSTPSEV